MILYRVQVGAYALKKNATKICADLIEKGFKPATIRENKLYKVQIGSFSAKENAVKRLAEVKKYSKYKNAKILLFDDGKSAADPAVPAAAPEEPEKPFHPVIDFIAIWLTESCESKYGDAQVFIEYAEDGSIAHAVLVDTGMDGTDTVKKLQNLGVKTLDAVVISHAHGDHYGCLTTILEKFKVLHLLFPSVVGVKKYQPSYAKAIYNQEAKAKKKNIPVTYLTTGSCFTTGHIRCDCIFQADAEKLSDHGNHIFINDMSIATLFTLDGVGRVMLTGDMSNGGNKQFISKASRPTVDVAKCGWHGDGNAMTIDYAKWINAKMWYWNYHHKESQGGRGNTRKKLEAAGVKYIFRNYEDGDIRYRYYAGYWTITTSKSKRNISIKARLA